MPPSARKKSAGGFALLITITLLAFLVLLLVSLASLTRVETQVAANNQQLGQARQNALMALNIALGQLQKYAGPDQRVTARSDMDAALVSTTTASGRWTGVYGNGVPVGATGATDKYAETPDVIANNIASYYSANSADSLVLKSSQARLLNWLVSGNETSSFNPATDMGADGHIINAGSSISYAPTDAVANLSGATALSMNLTIKTAAARLLVGPQSVSTAGEYVAAPLVPISAIAPGFTSSVPIGGYAWWVGDEGAKARINLPAPDIAQKPLAFVSAQRTAIELVDGKNAGTVAFQSSDKIGAAYDPASGNLTRIISAGQLPLLPTSPADVAALKSALGHRFHDLTGYSSTVLSDTYAGGLKKDLSGVLATGTSTPLDTDFIFAAETNTSADPNLEFGLPTWGQLRSYAQTTDTGGLPPAVPVMQKIASSAKPVATSVGIAPVLTYVALGFRYVAPDGDVTDGRVRLAIYPLVVLWNPYTTDMRAGQYEVGIQRPTVARIQLQGQAGPPSVEHPWDTPDIIENRDLSYGATSTTADPYFRFVIDNTEGIPAGKSMVFTLRSSGADYVPGNTASSALLTSAYNKTNYVLLPAITDLRIGTAPVPAAGGIYRVGVNRNPTRQPSGTGPTAAVTYLPSSTTADNSQGTYWSGYNSQQAYLGAVASGSPLSFGTDAAFPYHETTFASRQWYQTISRIKETTSNCAPFGPVVGFPCDPAAAVVVASGPDAGKYSGLLQSEGELQPGGDPAWRMHVKATFQNSTERWIAQNNPRAFISTNSFLNSVANFTGSDYKVTTWPPIDVYGTGPTLASSGNNLLNVPALTSPTATTLFEFRPGTTPLLAIGQLQHANLGWLGACPSYSIGNSLGPTSFDSASSNYQSFILPSAPGSLVRKTSIYGPQSNTSALFTAVYDQSWLLNRALWDRYFVSTVPYEGTGTDADSSVTSNTTVPDPLPNPRHVRYNVDPSVPPSTNLRNVDTAAAHLLLAGGFNINSTSEQAWRAVLGGTNQLSYDPTGGSSPYAGPVYSRFSKPSTNSTTSIWQGYRQLTEAQIAQFAKNIVAEIRNRGPFISLADFINRRLGDNGAFPVANDKRIKGTIQAAIDATTTGAGAVNDATQFSALVTTDPVYVAPKTPVYHAMKTGIADGSGPVAKAPFSTTAAFAPQFLTQADVLSAIGSGLSARSDTFVIRTYGEVVSPVDSTEITGRAWCEATVQRLPDYVNVATASSALGDPPETATAALQNTDNQKFGRRFKIISFRWLSQNDI